MNKKNTPEPNDKLISPASIEHRSATFSPAPASQADKNKPDDSCVPGEISDTDEPSEGSACDFK